MSRGVLTKAAALFRELGLLRMALYLQTRLPTFSFFEVGLQQVVALDLERLTTGGTASDQVREADRSEIALLTGFGAQPASLEAFFGRGYRVWVIERGGRLVAYDWLATSHKRFWEVIDLVGGEGDLWHWHYEVDEAYRGQGLGTKIRRHVAGGCRDQGYRRLLGNYELGNKGSKRVLEKLGYRPLRRLIFLRLGTLKILCLDWQIFLGRWTKEDRLTIDMESRRAVSGFDAARPAAEECDSV